MASTYQVSTGDAAYTLHFAPGSAGAHVFRVVDASGSPNDRLAHVLESTIKLTSGEPEPFASHASFDALIRQAGLDILSAEVGSD